MAERCIVVLLFVVLQILVIHHWDATDSQMQN